VQVGQKSAGVKMSDIPRSIGSGIINIMGVEIECRRLDNGQAVITAESLERFLYAMANGFPEPERGGMEEYAKFLRCEMVIPSEREQVRP
jgi:hypothetical protein